MVFAPTPPPRDKEGNILPHDAGQIANDSLAIRRVSEVQLIVDKNSGTKRISSMLYKTSSAQPNSTPGMSIDIEQYILADGKKPSEWVTTPRWFGSVKFMIGELRKTGFMVGYDPLTVPPAPEANPYHGEVWGKFTSSQGKYLAGTAEWYVEIPGVALR